MVFMLLVILNYGGLAFGVRYNQYGGYKIPLLNSENRTLTYLLALAVYLHFAKCKPGLRVH